MGKNQMNGGKNMGVKKSSSEIIFRLELSSLPSDEDRTKRISDRFLMCAENIKEIDNEADQGLLWLVGVAEEIFMAKKCSDPDKLWDLNIYLRDIYHALSLQNKQKFIFPETKKEMLRIILEQWDVQKCDECGQKILSFIWKIYTNERPLEESKTIDVLIMNRLKDSEAEKIIKWMTWIDAETNKPDVTPMHESLSRNFIKALARASSFNGVMRALKAVDDRKRIIEKDLQRLAEVLRKRLALREKDGEKIVVGIRSYNRVYVQICSDLHLGFTDYDDLLEKIIEPFMLEKGFLCNDSDRGALLGGFKVFLDLMMYNKDGYKEAEKVW